MARTFLLSWCWPEQAWGRTRDRCDVQERMGALYRFSPNLLVKGLQPV
jgi:hypothetical protein